MEHQTLAAVVHFHGHLCPGLAIGIRAAELALKEIGPPAADEEVVAIVETDMCGVDAIQFMTGCTFGKGNLIHLDYGKNVFTFIRRSDGKAIRLVTKPQSLEESKPESVDSTRLQLGQADMITDENMKIINRQRVQEILEVPFDTLFDMERVEPHIYPKARVRESVQCQECGENVMETRIRLLGGRLLCIPCFEAAQEVLDG